MGENIETAGKNAAHAIGLRRVGRFMVREMPSENLFQTASG